MTKNKENISTISLARRLRHRDLFYFTPSLLSALFSLERRQAYRLLARLKSEGMIAEVEKGKFLLLGLEPERVLSHPLFIAAQLVTPAYISYWSALHFYGYTEQVPLTTFVVTTRKKRSLQFREFRFYFVQVKPHKFFGYRRERVDDLPLLIADEAKAIIDSLDQLRYAGGIGEVAKALRAALEVVDIPTLVEYANHMGEKTLGSRLGYLLERLGHPIEGLIRSATPVKLDPGRPRRGRYERRWQVIVNVPETELWPEGVG